MQSDSDDTKKGSEEGFKNSLRIKRNRPDSLKKTPHYVYSDPPWVAEQLAFTVFAQKEKISGLTRKIKNGFRKSRFKHTQDCTEELGKLINADPRLGDLLSFNFLMLLVELLEDEENPELQINAAIILQPLVICPSNKDVVAVIEFITPVVLDLLSSGEYLEYLVRKEALWLLRNLVFAIPKSILGEVLEEAMVPVTSFLIKDSTGFVVLHASAEALLVFCQEHPKLSPEKLKLALRALMKLIQSDILSILSSASWGLAHLCDGREEMVVEDEYLDCLIERLVDLMNANSRVMIISALHALGSIVRWGSDNVIEAIIKKDALGSLMCLLKESDMSYVKQACWIISNITARKEEHIKAVIDCKLIDPLFDVVKNYKLGAVKKEALWAISNAMCGVGPDQIECLRNSCFKVLWYELLYSISFQTDRPLALVTFEGLVNMKMVQVTWGGRPIDAVELHYIFKKIVYHTKWFTLFKILRCNNNVQNSDTVKFLLEFKFEARKPFLLIHCDSLESFNINWNFYAEIISSRPLGD